MTNLENLEEKMKSLLHQVRMCDKELEIQWRAQIEPFLKAKDFEAACAIIERKPDTVAKMLIMSSIRMHGTEALLVKVKNND